MPTTLQWGQILLRLVCATAGGAVIGFNRSERARPAGLRTTTLVCVAAATAMIQANLLLTTGGKAPDSFSVMDVMRLPLGILTGMGFIGAGAILRRGEMVLGVTTAATLWFVTVAGLCFGGGQLALGAVSICLALGVLWGFKRAETRIRRERIGRVTLNVRMAGKTEGELESGLHALGLRIVAWNADPANPDAARQVKCEIQWKTDNEAYRLPRVLETLAQTTDMQVIEWCEVSPQVS